MLGFFRTTLTALGLQPGFDLQPASRFTLQLALLASIRPKSSTSRRAARLKKLALRCLSRKHLWISAEFGAHHAR
jgi:hypothetical protein